MAALLNVEMAGLAQVMQYEDDSLEAWFADGARILLTACGSAFTRQEDTTNGGLAHPPSGCSVHQFTAYAVQGWRKRVRQLVIFRNYFAERPFLAQSLIDTELQVGHEETLVGSYFFFIFSTLEIQLCVAVCSMALQPGESCKL